MTTETGTWFIQDNTLPPAGATYAVVANPTYSGSRPGLKLILCWDYLISYDAPWTTANLQTMETSYKALVSNGQAAKFWGILFLGEENYKKFITAEGSVTQGFDADMDITWFDESLQGYTVYHAANPSATVQQWGNEMMLRMLRGFYTYWHAQGLQVGITGGGSSLIPNATQDTQGDMRYGTPAINYIAATYDFIFAYNYTRNLSGLTGLNTYMAVLDSKYSGQKIFWILTRSFTGYNIEAEAVALEMKKCLDRSYVITTYEDTLNDGTPAYTLAQWWTYLQTCITLYQTDLSDYHESLMVGINYVNQLTGATAASYPNLMYGWVAASWQLTIVAGSHGSTNPAAGSTTRSGGETVPIYAYPEDGYFHSGWSVNGVSVAAVNPYPVTCTGLTVTIQPVFSLIPTWTLTASAGANGSVSSASQSAILSTPLSVTFTPSANYLLDTVTLNGTAITPILSNTIYSNGNTATQTISATFKAATWTLNASVASGNGSITYASQTANLASDLTVTALADPNWQFGYWVKGGVSYTTNPLVASSGGSSTTQTAEVNFIEAAPPAPTTWQLAITSTVGGTTDLTGIQVANVGSGITVTATPATGYHFVHFILDGVVVTSGNAPAWLLLKTVMGW
jgi:hypothetical protein